MQRHLRASVLMVLLVGTTACDGVQPESASEPSARSNLAVDRVGLRIGDLAPDFGLRDLDSKVVSLSDYRGKVVFINFWATWCGPCRVEMPAMEILYREFARKDFEILAISTDLQGVSVTRPFKDSLNLTFPILHDSDFRVSVAYAARSLPMTFLVDRRGVIRHRIFGAREWQSSESQQLIRTVLRAS